MSADGGVTTPREWVGSAQFPWPPALSAADGDEVVGCFSVTRVDAARTRSDAPFLKLQLTDCYGPVQARMWEGVEPFLDQLRPGMYVGVRGRIERYQEERQLRIDEMALLRVELDDLVLFLPRSARPAAHMDAELDALIASIHDGGMRRLLLRMLASDSGTGQAFRLAPAAKQNHHAYLGGLLEHTLSVARLCDLLVDHYGAAADRDLLITAALLHDIGKVREIGALAGFPYTDEGKLLGHIIIGMQMVADEAQHVPEIGAARLLLLQHLIAAHQGRYEWQSPREPRTLEALILHYADDLDAKYNQVHALIGAVDSGWSAYDRSFGRDFLRHMPAAGAAPAPARSAKAAEPVAKTSAAAPSAPEPAPAAPERERGIEVRSPEPHAEAEHDREAPAPGMASPLDTLDLFENL